MTHPATLPVTEAARLLGVGRDTLYRAVKRQEIPHVAVGARVLIPRWWLDQKLKALEPHANVITHA